jgi:AcrR family transcriptional regulator
MPDPSPSRRDRRRQQTLEEINQYAGAQVAEGGVAALSLNAIAKAMGMSGPAIYRYYASREDLLAAVVAEGYGELARVVETAAEAVKRRSPDERLRRVVGAYSDWALANPYRYEMLFSVRPAGYSDPDEAIAAIQPAMRVLLEILGELAVPSGGTAAPGPDGALEKQLSAWFTSRREDPDPDALPPGVLLLGVLTWTRLHGILMLQLAGVIADMGLDASLLLRAELDSVVAAAR